ncbi:TonB-dependent receptor [Sphingobium sp. EM0848]|uniref:TonB-dependent receptor n=1 Tax=Sphingobium sp. EM0848 TaxID=2743473 RepID=UPI00159C7067|nr:TonB-dependent receptor [Sphingobium sp. EM0848]
MLSSDGLADIVVTAQKREESLQSTPISIDVLSDRALEQRGIATITDFISGAAPSLRIAPFAGRASAVTIGMRGLVPTDATQISRDPTVGIYIDGVYLGRVQGLGTELVDVERIEVLRGPQGTLFGRNAVGGALSIITKKPTGKFGVDMTGGLRNWDGRSIAAHVNLPEVAGISVKLDGVYNKRDGWVENPLAGASDWNAIKRYGFRAAALWKPAANLSIEYAFDTSTDKSTGGYPHIEYMLPGAPPLAPIFSVDGRRTRHARGGFALEPSVGKVKGHVLHAEWDIGDALTLRSITAYRELDQTQHDNSSGAFLAFRPNGFEGRASFAGVDQDQFSEELQLVGTTDRLNYVLGAFYFDENATDVAFAPFTSQFNANGTAINTLPVPVSATPYPDRASEAHAKSKALYGQATWTPPVLDDRLHLTGGLRYTGDSKHGRMTKLRGADAPPALRFEFRSKRVDPAATIAFDISDNVNSYLRWGNAYRAGGANSRSTIFRPFAEETVESWELGLKSDLFDRHVRLNLAAYASRLKDMQLDFTSPANPSATETINGDRDAKIKGVEADLTIAPGGGFTLTGNYVFTDADVPPQINPFTNRSERIKVAQTPRHAATMALDYRFPALPDGTLSAHVDGNWSSGYYSSATDPMLSNKVLLLNARLTLGDLKVGSGKVDVSIWGKNLTDQEYQLFDFELASPGLINANQTYFSEPRTYGVDVRFRF